MAEFFLMPKLGMDMEEGSVVKWLKAEGDTVAKGEALAEIETDKSSVEVEAPCGGTVLKIYAAEGDAYPCGAPIAYIGNPGDVIPAPDGAPAAEEPAAAASASAAPAEPQAAASTENCFLMPKLGMDMEEGTVVKWLKAEGDTVAKGEALAEIETDKSSVEVESPFSGTVLKIYVPEGEAKACGTPIAYIGTPGDAIPAFGDAPAAAPAVPAAPTAPTAPAAPKSTHQTAPAKAAAPAARPVAPAAQLTPGGRLRVSPRAARLAEKNGVELSLVTGTGHNGRIVEQDVRDFIAAGGNARFSAPAVRTREETVTPLKGVRKVTANRMRQSLQEMAQTNTRMDVNMSNMISFRSQINARLAKDGVKVSFVDLMVAVCAKALIEHPQANCSLMDDGIHYRNYANIGIAVDTDRGLVVPVIKDADILTIPEIARASAELIDKARRGALTPDDMKGGSFTISNLGMFEVDSFTAIVNPPETCILAMSRTADRAVVEDGQVVVRPMMNLCLSYDHRVIDGAPSARFLRDIKHYIENPVWLLV